jgi:hypothetical protein
MHTHANARLTQKGRLRLVSGHLNDHRPLAELAAEAGISLRCAYKWGLLKKPDRLRRSLFQRSRVDKLALIRAINDCYNC